ncbi:iron-sulfur cluster assembly protein [Starkeya sp. ORNL1]|uniref:metal-sulfur cluster assembly factor n=1 Tax=Starkeya sp. ORNL1 TaxID=2709380 RepID=UPI0014643F86|nr:iron-sulfur cluster assembly protein [Starkeya sp. ORNL1]QJP16889.1 iron-sulfur cluster assembly protein [Starkeya sp. ORNL1]
MGSSASLDRRTAAVWERASHVMDPELDESIVDLGFVEDVDIDADGGVYVRFRLPTYWCSPNFAFLMADDIARAVRALPWVGEVRPRLEDHMCSDEVNRGVELGLSFADAFAGYQVGGSIEELRETFLRKAFQRRQEAVMLGFRRAGCTDAELVAMDLARFDRFTVRDAEGLRQKPRYRSLLLERGLAAGPQDLAFVTLEGEPIAASGLAAHLRALRAIRINMEANGALCRGLSEARYREHHVEPAEPGEEHACGAAGKAEACSGCALGGTRARPDTQIPAHAPMAF